MARPKIAAVVTEYRKYSHAQHIVDRFLYGYGWNGRHHRPPMDLVSLYTDQVPEGDASRARAKEIPSLRIYPTVAEALTRGGEKLAVDGVLLIGEHGTYPKNEKGQHLYPRYELFQKIVDVFRDSGKSVPVFNDKHLSWNWDWAKEMVQTARDMGFALMAGSSLPVARRIPPVEMPAGAEVEEAMSVALGGPDSYDFHALETLQTMVERRRGGETGVVAMQALKGDAVWAAMDSGSWEAGGWDPRLFEACLCRSQTLTSARPGFSHVLPSKEEVRRLRRNPVAYRFEYADGLKATILIGDGLVRDFNFAARLKSHREPLSTLMFLPYYDLQNFFSPLVNHIETLFSTGKSPYPIERTLLTTGLTAAGVESLFQGQKRIATPHLRISYQPTHDSTYWRT
ncbi:MAG: hypothetical protein QGH33_09625 [Pirellulaceae bacterium]|nr:hypothetical protein [Pirellulaceae bacterium]HJN09473.1 hypothetical protein [Pirellulaceae bacterium]